MTKDTNTLKELFKGYYSYSDNEYKQIWEKALIVLDANILLSFYRYSNETRETFLNVLKKEKNRVWIPYQVGKEFFSNKDKIMDYSYNMYDDLKSKIGKYLKKAIEETNHAKNNELKCKKEISKIIEDSISKIEKALNKEKEDKKQNIEKNDIETTIFDLFNENIGMPFNEDEKNKVKAEGNRRVKESIPPGFKDNKKEENGDYYIFYSLIKKAKEDNKDIIFITDDVKEDWFYKSNGKNHGGRYELLNEFYKESGQLLMVYTSDGFLKSYSKNIEPIDVDRDLINDLIKIRNSDILEQDSIQITNSNILDYKKLYNTIDKILKKETDEIQTNQLKKIKQQIISYYNNTKAKDNNNLLLIEIQSNFLSFIIKLKHAKSKDIYSIYNEILEYSSEILNHLRTSSSFINESIIYQIDDLRFFIIQKPDRITVVKLLNKIIDNIKSLID